ncbi:MAG: hypothetical protein HDS07_08385 [Bacteroides sp.]|nr:hypothetical protein [Bacteroides sp.]
MKSIHLILIALLYPLSSQAYSHLSPYSYCGGDPVNCIDPTGEDIVVLNFGYGMNQHLAMLIQDVEGKWQYYSVNGNNMYFSGSHSGGRTFNDVAVGSWDSPQEFLHSSYNVRNENSKDNKSMNHFGFEEGYQISTTPEQDATMRNSFSKTAKSEYDLIDNNCATAVQKAMVEAGIPVSEPKILPSYIPMSTPFGLVDVFNGYKLKCDFNIVPSSAFQSIMKWNPTGVYFHK